MSLGDMVPRYARIYHALRERIRRGVYPAGSRLPAQQLLATEFGVNIGTLRHAIDLLVREGLVQTRPGIGTLVVEPVEGGDRPLVVVADDNAELRQVLREIVEAEGFQVAEAADGVEAVEVASSPKVGVVFLDQRMPRMNGVEARARLAQTNPRSVVVMVTAYPEELGELQDCQTWPLVVIRKPFTRQEIVDALRMGARVWEARAGAS